jgi:hypothetical protein
MTDYNVGDNFILTEVDDEGNDCNDWQHKYFIKVLPSTEVLFGNNNEF